MLVQHKHVILRSCCGITNNEYLQGGRARSAGKTLIKVLERVAVVMEVLEARSDIDCYDQISMASKPRELSKADYSTKYGVVVNDLKCMVTGTLATAKRLSSSKRTCNTESAVVLAHLLPRGANASTRLSLGYQIDDIENIRNSLLLCKGMEEAFDSKYISFVPSEVPFSNNQYILHIWCEEGRKQPIYNGSSTTIGSFDGKPLDLSVGEHMHDPFKRALSYQAYRAFKKWGKINGMTDLPLDSDMSEYAGTYKMERENYAKRLARDLEDEADEDEEAYEDGAYEDEGADEDENLGLNLRLTLDG